MKDKNRAEPKKIQEREDEISSMEIANQLLAGKDFKVGKFSSIKNLELNDGTFRIFENEHELLKFKYQTNYKKVQPILYQGERVFKALAQGECDFNEKCVVYVRVKEKIDSICLDLGMPHGLEVSVYSTNPLDFYEQNYAGTHSMSYMHFYILHTPEHRKYMIDEKEYSKDDFYLGLMSNAALEIFSKLFLMIEEKLDLEKTIEQAQPSLEKHKI